VPGGLGLTCAISRGLGTKPISGIGAAGWSHPARSCASTRAPAGSGAGTGGVFPATRFLVDRVTDQRRRQHHLREPRPSVGNERRGLRTFSIGARARVRSPADRTFWDRPSPPRAWGRGQYARYPAASRGISPPTGQGAFHNMIESRASAVQDRPRSPWYTELCS